MNIINNWETLYKFWSKFTRYSRALGDGRFLCKWHDRRPCLSDATTDTSFDTHYVYHTAWAARLLVQIHPERHIDIGSCLRFVTISSAFIPIDFYDFRPPPIRMSNLCCKYADLKQLPFEDDSVFSISCMHVVEHIGLTRYGDAIDPKGDIKAIKELCRVTAKGGHLLFAIPLGGVAKIQFNAHRIYTYDQIYEYLIAEGMTLKEFSLITDNGDFILHAKPKDASFQSYGCGCFHCTK